MGVMVRLLVATHPTRSAIALIHCKECGTLNSDQSEICLSCEYPVRGQEGTNWWKRLAIILAILIGLPVGLIALDMLRHIQPASQTQRSPAQQ
jgi:RNA polymerase subunit RPABC4/transcription elongation factor Spt4